MNNFFGIDTPFDVKQKSKQMFEIKGSNDSNQHVLTEEEAFDKNIHKFFGIQEKKGPSL